MPIDVSPTKQTARRQFDIEGMVKRKMVTHYTEGTVIGVTLLVSKRGDASYGPPLYWNARCTACGHEHPVAHRNLSALRNRTFCNWCSPTGRKTEK